MNKIEILKNIKNFAFQEEIDKIALNLEEARKASNILKPRIKRQISEMHTGQLVSFNKNLAEVARDQVKNSLLLKIITKIGPLKGMSEAMEDIVRHSKELHGKIQQPHGGAIRALTTKPKMESISKLFMNKKQKSNLAKYRTQMMNLPVKSISKEDKEMINRIGLMHEGAEIKVKKRNVAPIRSHVSPEVLLKEHNMIITLDPKKYPGSINFFKTLRNITGENKLLSSIYPGFKYGQGSRLSRHKIKGMTNQFIKEQKMNPIHRTISNFLKKKES